MSRLLALLTAAPWGEPPPRSHVAALAVVLAYMGWRMAAGWVFPIDEATLLIHSTRVKLIPNIISSFASTKENWRPAVEAL